MSGQSALMTRAQVVAAVRKVEMTNKNIKSPMSAGNPEMTNKNIKSPKSIRP